MDEEMRFTMLESIREFAAEQLSKASETYRLRHARFFCALAQSAGQRLTGPEQAAWLARLDSEDANLREALGFSLERSEGHSALKAALALWRFWWVRGRTLEASHWLQEALAAATKASPLERAEAVQCLGNLAWREGENEKALGLYREALTLRERAEDRLAAAKSLGSIGNVCRSLVRPDEAKEAYERSLEIFQELNDPQGAATSLLNLGTLAEDGEDYQAAYGFYHRALGLYHELGDLHSEGLTLCNLGNICICQHNAESARRFLAECLRIGLSLNDHPRLGTLLAACARLAILENEPIRAAELIGAAEEFHRRHALPITPAFREELDSTCEQIRQSAPESDVEAACTSGRSLSDEAALDRALAEPLR
jgi:tetratricopeptide (TPR) repeat protein